MNEWKVWGCFVTLKGPSSMIDWPRSSVGRSNLIVCTQRPFPFNLQANFPRGAAPANANLQRQGTFWKKELSRPTGGGGGTEKLKGGKNILYSQRDCHRLFLPLPLLLYKIWRCLRLDLVGPLPLQEVPRRFFQGPVRKLPWPWYSVRWKCKSAFIHSWGTAASYLHMPRIFIFATFFAAFSQPAASSIKCQKFAESGFPLFQHLLHYDGLPEKYERKKISSSKEHGSGMRSLNGTWRKCRRRNSWQEKCFRNRIGGGGMWLNFSGIVSFSEQILARFLVA